MFEFVMYELKVAVILAAFYLCFKVLLCNEKMHRMNRIVLILTAALSFILPLCIITFHKTVLIQNDVMSGVIESVDSDTVEAAVLPAASSFPWESILVVLYWIGVLVVITSVIVGIARVMRIIMSGTIRQFESSEVVVCEKDVPPFSWMKWIVMSKLDFESGNRHILEHEKAHVRLGHSRDVLLVDIMSAFQWFNPAIWLLKADLRAIHEYEADDSVLRAGVNIKEYQYSLIRKAVSASGYSITNSFNHSILKNRITMMSKSNASRMRWLRVIYFLPLVCGTLALNARTVIEYESSEIPLIQQTPTKVEIKMENGKIAYYIDGQKTAFDQLPQKFSSMDSKTIDLVVDGNINMGVVTDLKEALKSLDVNKINSMTVTPKSETPSKSQKSQSETPKSKPVQEPKVTTSQFSISTNDAQVDGVIDGVALVAYGPKRAPQETVATDEVPVAFSSLSKKPAFNGSDASEFSKWVAMHLVYPESAKNAGVQGMVTVQFKINADGSVSDINVLRGICAALDEEAVRVVASAPAWTPGEVDGKSVATTYTFPIVFNIR
ncbi:MAG: TonB family protein [Bacteroidales bacterium]|nr:TonB family protein [Bacteroidales bacterium]